MFFKKVSHNKKYNIFSISIESREGKKLLGLRIKKKRLYFNFLFRIILVQISEIMIMMMIHILPSLKQAIIDVPYFDLLRK